MRALSKVATGQSPADSTLTPIL